MGGRSWTFGVGSLGLGLALCLGLPLSPGDPNWSPAAGTMGQAQAAEVARTEAVERLLNQFTTPRQSGFFAMIIQAWTGQREEVNAKAAEIDQHYFGAIVLWQLANWCQCGSPWDVEVTPNFAAKLEEANMVWPPENQMNFPLKDW